MPIALNYTIENHYYKNPSTGKTEDIFLKTENIKNIFDTVILPDGGENQLSLDITGNCDGEYYTLWTSFVQGDNFSWLHIADAMSSYNTYGPTISEHFLLTVLHNFNNDIMKAGLEDKIGRLQDKCIITESYSPERKNIFNDKPKIYYYIDYSLNPRVCQLTNPTRVREWLTSDTK